MSSARSMSCILPLLDGDAEASPRVIAVDSVSGDVGDLQKLYKNNKDRFDSYVCTAWAILLRCYTGLDLVCFQLYANASQEEAGIPSEPRQAAPLLQLALGQDEPLSNIVERATATTVPKDKRQPGAKPSNTGIIIYNDQLGQLPIPATRMEISKASYPKYRASGSNPWSDNC